MLHESLLVSLFQKEGDDNLRTNNHTDNQKHCKFHCSLETHSVCRITDKIIDQSIQAKT